MGYINFIMKQTLFILIMAGLLSSCNNGNPGNAVSDAIKLQSVIKKMQPGGIATTEGGWTMKAKIDAKNWVAASIISPKAAGRIAGDNDGESIGLPYNRRAMVVGNKIIFSHDNAVDLFTHDDVGLWGGYAGEMEITKVDGKWAEGKSFFTATGNSTDQIGERKVKILERKISKLIHQLF